jgi:hypothetical protein
LTGLEPLLGSPIGRQTELSQLAQGARQPQRIGAEALFGGFSIQEFGVEQRVQHGRDNHVVVGIEGPHDLSHIQSRAQHGKV